MLDWIFYAPPTCSVCYERPVSRSSSSSASLRGWSEKELLVEPQQLRSAEALFALQQLLCPLGSHNIFCAQLCQEDKVHGGGCGQSWRGVLLPQPRSLPRQRQSGQQLARRGARYVTTAATPSSNRQPSNTPPHCPDTSAHSPSIPLCRHSSSNTKMMQLKPDLRLVKTPNQRTCCRDLNMHVQTHMNMKILIVCIDCLENIDKERSCTSCFEIN